jgi:hypothetical protein
MTSWTSDELDRIGAADELELAARQPDGTLRNPVTIWVVPVGDDLYVRSWRGRDGSWFRAAQARPEGHISAGGVDKDVAFDAVADEGINDAVDRAYSEKYRRYSDSYVEPMVGPQARATTLRLVARDDARGS